MRTPLLTADITIPAQEVTLIGDLVMPHKADALVLFIHGNGSNRHSWRNLSVAQQLNEQGLATLLFDLLTVDENAIDHLRGELRFNIELLGARLMAVLEWAAVAPQCAHLPLGCFGSSTGAAAALIAAAHRPQLVRAVVARGGRPDLVSDRDLSQVRAPSLFIVGELDTDVLELNHQAMATIGAPVQLEIVPAAGHLFEEPEALPRVAELAGSWLGRHVAGRAPRVRKTRVRQSPKSSASVQRNDEPDYPPTCC